MLSRSAFSRALQLLAHGRLSNFAVSCRKRVFSVLGYFIQKRGLVSRRILRFLPTRGMILYRGSCQTRSGECRATVRKARFSR